MKRFISTLIATSALTVCAQQALWSHIPLTSPQINPDTTVTFRLNAPLANNVLITGDFLKKQTITNEFGEMELPGTAELVKNPEGIWEYTSEKLSPELYSYNFIVDSIRINDPSNIYITRDISSLSNIFIIPGEHAVNYTVNDVPHGSVSKVWYDSPTLGLKRRMSVYTPAGYETGDSDYPVLYLLHGMGGDEEAWLTLGRASQIIDNLIASGKADPMIVAMPNGNASQQAAPGESPEGLIKPDISLPRTMDGSFEESFPEIVSFVDSAYRTIPDKKHRAIAGLSMGGFHACHISKQFPDMFDYVGLFSAAITPRSKSSSHIYSDLENKLRYQFSNPPELYWIGIGSSDFLYDENVKFRNTLDNLNIPYTYFESPDGHIWKNWRLFLLEFTPKLFK